MNIDLTTFADWCGGYYRGALQSVCGVSIDSRKIEIGDVFFALKGVHVNGEDYVVDALKAGAVCAVVSKSYSGDGEAIIVVDDVLYALQEAALNYRKTISIKIIAVTGSVGKTTTKEMLAAVLSTSFKTFASKGNYNNEIGLPLMIFELDNSYDWAVLEMGMNRYGEITRLSQIALPSIAVITNIGTAHIEFFGTKQNILKAKLEIVDFFTDKNTLFVNDCDALLHDYHNKRFEVIRVGQSDNLLYAKNIFIDEDNTHFDLIVNNKAYRAKIRQLGDHHVLNALLAIAVGLHLGIKVESVIIGIDQSQAKHMRFEREKIEGITFINDAYNASYDSIIASIDTFIKMAYNRRIVVLGDVFECGAYTEAIHKEIGTALNNYQLDSVIFTGSAMAYAKAAYCGAAEYFENKMLINSHLKNYLKVGDAVLLKASRGMALETIVDDFRSKK